METQALEGTIAVQGRTSGGTLAESDAERRVMFERLTQARINRAYRLATAILRNPEDAQDAVHDACEQAWDRWGALRNPERFDAWFDAIVVHRCQDRLRRRRVPAVRMPDPPVAPAPDPFARSAERASIASVLDTLDPRHRVVLVLRFVEDLSVAEIAARTGEREGTVKSRLHYALRHLRAAYDAAARAGEAR